jgi:hypothetical protein
MFRNDFTRITTSPVLPANRAGLPMGAGLLADTMVETQRGWRPAEALRLGDRIQTLDGGLAPVVGLDRQWITPDPDLHLVQIPGGTISNDADLTLLAGQHVLIDTLGDALLPDAALVLIPAVALIGWRGVRRLPLAAGAEIITPLFAAEEIVYAHTGAMLRCPGIVEGAHAAMVSDFTRLDLRAAWALLARLDGGPMDGAGALRAA